jgi:hypothetical protein
MDRDLHDERLVDRAIAHGNQNDARNIDRKLKRTAVVAKHERPTSQTQDLVAPDGRVAYELRDRSYRLNDLEARMLADIGTFRATEKADLLCHVYKGDKAAFERDLTHLHRQSLVRIVGPRASPTKYIALTKPAKQLTEKYLRANPRQEIYSGAVKIRELKHDATLYRLYEKVAKEMEERDERPLRVVLDYELKRNINKALAKTKELSWQQKQQRMREIAHENNLKVVNGKIPLPDLRIEYERPDGDDDVRDLEYITEHYRSRSFAEKAAAGFTLYGDGKRGHKPYGPDLIGGLVAL